MPEIRKTRQRDVVKEVLAAADRPLTPAEIHELASRVLPKIGLRTVYRHLKDMNEEMEIAGIDYPGQPMRYEIADARGSHPHFVCRDCNKVFDLPIDEPALTHPKLKDYNIDAHEVIFYGTCKDCKPKE